MGKAARYKMQIAYWLPNGKSMTAREDHWPNVGDYIVKSVHFTMTNCCDLGTTKISCLTVTLMDAPDGRQNECYVFKTSIEHCAEADGESNHEHAGMRLPYKSQPRTCHAWRPAIDWLYEIEQSGQLASLISWRSQPIQTQPT